jgi:small subunit ribosomal protein S20
MAHTKSARKRIRQDAKRHLRNQSVKTRVRSLTKKFRLSLEESDTEVITKALHETVRELNKAASKGIIHHKTASRKISRLNKAAHKKLSPAAAEAPASAS